MKDIKLANLPGMGEVLAVAQVENVPHAKVAVIDGKRTTASCAVRPPGAGALVASRIFGFSACKRCEIVVIFALFNWSRSVKFQWKVKFQWRQKR